MGHPDPGRLMNGISNRSYACVAEPAAAPVGVIQFVGDFKPGLVHFLDDHLGDAFTPPDRIAGIAEIDQCNFDLSPVVGVNGARVR